MDRANNHIENDRVKEKLVELLCALPCDSDCDGEVGSCPDRKHGYCYNIFKLPYCSVSGLASHLIANGVTVQEMNVVEVVRCKDCVYFRPAEDWNGKKYNACYLKPNVCIFEKKMEDFCSCGERRLPQPPKGGVV